jgi:predicted glycoside hydrolase/deacetylase ChbG (UPF0249 family)
MRRLTLCADDYGQSAGICDGILQLIALGRLSATSVFSESPGWPDAARALPSTRIDIGLHLNLTEAYSADSRPLSYWLLNSQLRRLAPQRLRDRILAQIDAFACHLNRLPDYIDGHQHVHALPQVRQALSEAIALRWVQPAAPYLRRPDRLADPGDAHFKTLVLKTCCAGFSRHLHARGLVGPDWFAGLYSLGASADYRALMRRWLAHCPDGGLIMCHPGLADPAPDPIAATRPLEYRYLASDDFLSDCQQQQIELSRWPRQIG